MSEQQAQPTPAPNAYVVTVIKEPVKQTTIADVIVGSLGITGVLVLLSLVLGVAFSFALRQWNHRHPARIGDAPTITPFPPDPPSSPAP